MRSPEARHMALRRSPTMVAVAIASQATMNWRARVSRDGTLHESPRPLRLLPSTGLCEHEDWRGGLAHPGLWRRCGPACRQGRHRHTGAAGGPEIGRASCRERVEVTVVRGTVK